MLLLESIHPALINAIKRMLSGENVVPSSAVREFDGCEFFIDVEPAKNNDGSRMSDLDDEIPGCRYTISITLKHVVPLKILNAFGNFQAVVTAFFPPETILKFGQLDSTTQGTTVVVVLPGSSIKLGDVSTPRDSVIALASQLRVFSYIPIFKHQFETYIANPEKVQPLRLPYHAGESMYLYQSKGNFLCVIVLNITGKDELTFLRNFLQTFVDAKKLEKAISGAPAFAFSNGKAPIDMPKGLAGEPEMDNVFWCSFQLFKLQMEKPNRVQETVMQLLNFRSVVMYHIHCCRTYMHSIMRKRVETSVQIINRARTSTTGKSKVTIK